MNPLFGLKHLILIALSFILIIVGLLLVRKLKFTVVCKTLFFIGIGSELIKVFYYIIRNENEYHGILPKTDLPFHLCSIQIIFFAILCFSQNEKIKKVLLSFMLPSCLFGGISAILIATDSSRNGLWILSLQYFGYHIAIVIFSLYLLLSKEITFTVKDYFNCLKFLLFLLFFAIYINSILYDGLSDINFMYVVGPPQDGLPFLNDNHGWLIYIIHYTIIVLLCVTICYINPIISAIKTKYSKHKV